MSSCLIAITLAGLLANGKAAPPMRAYIFVGTGTRIQPVFSDPARMNARSEIQQNALTTYARETPDEVATMPCIERRKAEPD